MNRRLFSPNLLRDPHNVRLLAPISTALEQARQADIKSLTGCPDWAACRFLQGRISALEEVIYSMSPPTQGDRQ